MTEPVPSASARRPTLVDRLGYGGFRLAEFALRFLPVGVVAALGGLGGRVFFVVSGTYRRLALRNLRIAFGREMDEKQRRRLLWRHAWHLGANFATSLKLPSMRREDIDARVEVRGREHVAHAMKRGQGIVFVLGHLGPWELLTQTKVYLAGPVQAGAVYQALANPLLDAHVRRTRERLEHHLFERREGFFASIAMLKAGGVLGVLADQHAGDAGVYAPFFGRLASTTTLPLLLARRAKAVLLTLGIETTGPARWRITLEPVADTGTGRVEEGLLALNRGLELMVRRSPADWFWVHNRWKTPMPAFLLQSQKRGMVLPPASTALQPFRVIIRSPNWLGDACMAVPAVRAIKAGRPDMELTILSPAKLADVWRAVPGVDAVICRDGKEGVLAVARKVKAAGPFDVGILFPNSPRTALEMRLGGVERLTGYAALWRRWWLDQVIPAKKRIGPPRHHVEHYLQIAHHVGVEDCNERSLFEPIGGGAPAAAPGPARIGLCAGAEYGPAKRWPLERFATMARQVMDAHGGAVEWVLFGAPGEVAMGAELERMLEGKCRNLVGKTSMVELMAELRACRFLVSNDTGTMHLAAMLGLPVIAIFGSTEPAWTRPLGKRHVILREHVECSPCFLRECPLDFRCMTAITPERVAAEVGKMLAQAGEMPS